jgi:hypothetical protein
MSRKPILHPVCIVTIKEFYYLLISETRIFYSVNFCSVQVTILVKLNIPINPDIQTEFVNKFGDVFNREKS